MTPVTAETSGQSMGAHIEIANEGQVALAQARGWFADFRDVPADSLPGLPRP